MEETLAPDSIISKTQKKIGNKVYTYYCKRKTREDAEVIQSDLITTGFDVKIRRDKIDGQYFYVIWWRKN